MTTPAPSADGNSEQRQFTAELQALFDHTDVLLWSIREDRDGGLWYEQVNAAFAAIDGRTPDHYNGRRLDDIHSPAELKAIRYSVDCARKGRPHLYEVRFERADTCRHFDIRFIPVVGPDGDIRRYIGTGTDITDRKLAADRLREIIENLPVMISAYAEDGTVLVRNREYVRVTGYDTTRPGNLADTYLALYPDETARREIRERLKTVSGDYRDWELEITCRDGSRRWVSWTDVSKAVRIPGWHKWGIGIDITERRRIEGELDRHRNRLESLVKKRTEALRSAQAELLRAEKLATLGQVAGGIAHELLNPLAVLKNAAFYLKLELDRDANRKVARHLSIIDDYVDRANRVVTTISDFTRGGQAKPDRCSIHWIIDRAIDEADLSGSIATDVRVAGDLPDLMVDDQQILVVFRNLVMNAAQAVSNVGTVTIVAVEHDRNIEIRVSDNGVGIAPENLPHIFEPLYTTREFGAGLGLAICKSFVEANLGTITVESEPGRGSTFTVRLPIA